MYMYLIMLWAIACIIVTLLFSYKIYKKNPSNISIPLVAIHLLFYFYPFYDFLSDSPALEYELLQKYSLNIERVDAALYFLITASLLMTFTISSYVFLDYQKGANIAEEKISNKKFKLMLLTMMLVSAIYVAFKAFGGGAMLLFTIARKELEISGYVKELLIVVPSLVGLIIFSDRRSFGVMVAYILIMIPVISILGVRREIIEFILFITFLNYRKTFRSKDGVRKIYGILFALVSILISVFWYLRVYFSQILRGDENIVNPFELRSPIALLFGSSTTGFESIFLQKKHWDLGNLEPGSNLTFILQAFIPREIFPDKQMAMAQKIKILEHEEHNISNFFLNEALFNFGSILSFVFVILFAIGMQKINKKFGIGLLGNSIFIYALANTITLFKNGWSVYLMSLFVYVFAAHFFLRWKFN